MGHCVLYIFKSPYQTDVDGATIRFSGQGLSNLLNRLITGHPTSPLPTRGVPHSFYPGTAAGDRAILFAPERPLFLAPHAHPTQPG